MPDESPIELELTPEQQAIIRRLSGKQAAVLQLTVNPETNGEGVGRALQFRWRLSESSGIPRQGWVSDKASEAD
jgi:hypothetical protein